MEKKNQTKLLIFISIFVTLAVLLILSFFHTIRLLSQGIDIFAQTPENVEKHYIFSIIVLVSNGIFFFYFSLSGKNFEKSDLTQKDLLLVFVILRLALIVFLEVFHVRPYHDYIQYMINYFRPVNNPPPLYTIYHILLHYEQESLLGFFGIPFSPEDNVYLLMIPRLQNLVIEVGCVFFSGKIFEKILEQKIHPTGFSGDAEISNSSKKFFALYIFSPIPLTFLYVWVTLDLLSLFFDLMAFYSFLNRDYSGTGIALALSVLMKIYGILYFVIYFVYLLKKREIKNLGKMTLSFSLLALGILVVFFLALGTSFGFMDFFLLLTSIKPLVAENFMFLNFHMVFYSLFPPILVIFGLIGIVLVIIFILRAEKVGVSSFMGVFALFSLFFPGFGIWWTNLIIFYFPFFIFYPEQRIRRQANMAICFFILSVVAFSIVAILTLNFYPNLSEDILIRSVFLVGKWPHILWLATSYSFLVLGFIKTLQISIYFNRKSRLENIFDRFL